MQVVHAEESHSSFQYVGRYLDLGPHIHATGWALHGRHQGADGRQWKAPILAVLWAAKVNDQTTASVG